MQIKLLNKGFIIPAMDVQNAMMELVSQFGSYENIPEENITTIVEYVNMVSSGEYYLLSSVFYIIIFYYITSVLLFFCYIGF